ncbi:MAG: PKD domain-containing protein [Bacteroidota bacterium]
MKNLFLYVILLLSIQNMFGQTATTVTALADTLWICEGDSAYLLAIGSTNYMMNNDFDNGTMGTGWSSNAGPMFTNPCLPSPNGTIYLWMGPAVAQPRDLTTIPYNVTDACQICFDMAYATQSNSSPCEGPDLSTEGVHLQYSINGGTTWIDINYWDPNGGYDPQMTSWNNYCEDIPPGAASTTTLFQWHQDQTSSNDYDHWGLDNVQIFCPNAFVAQWWEDSNGIMIDSGTTAGVLPPVSQMYYVNVVDSLGNSAMDSTFVSVYPSPVLSFTNLSTSYCINQAPFQLTATPAGGEFSGALVNASGYFTPNAVGPGTYDIEYHIYNLHSYWDSGIFTAWEDDFSTDLGWTGYGSGGWARGSATASTGCSGSQDPSIDHSPSADNFIIGTYLGACYPNSMAMTYWLTSPVINCTGLTNCNIEFFSQSGCESSSFDHMYVDVFNGTVWSNVYSNSGSFSEASWTQKTYNVAAQADNNPNFRVRFGLGSTDGSVTYGGWNIDDFKVTGSGSLYVTDTLCDFDITQSVMIFDAPSPAFTFSDSICVNTNTNVQYTGNASVSATYNWNFGTTGTIVSGSGQGPIIVTFNSAGPQPIYLQVDENGCISDTTIYITILPNGHPNCCILPTPDAGQDDNICSLSYTLQGVPSLGTGNWSMISGPGTAVFANSASATSSVTVDQYGDYVFQWFEDNGTNCDASDNVQISFIISPSFDFTVTDLLCNNVCAGTATVNPLGSGLPYTYLWDTNTGSQTGQTATGLCANTFYVTVTNSFGCTSSNSATVNSPAALTVNVTGVNPLCYSGSDGNATATPSGGTPVYTYLWSPNANNQTVADATNLGAGFYVITITDANNCTVSGNVTLTQPTQLTATTSSVQVSCFGGSDGTATVTASGGTGAYSYYWDPSGQTNQIATILTAGLYYVTVTDANICTTTSSVTVNQPTAPLSMTFDNTADINCFGGSDGMINISVTGGTPTYTYLWNSGQTSQNLNNIPIGSYCVTVTDAFSCTLTDCVTLTQPNQLTQTTSSTPTNCWGGFDGQASITVSNGTPPYTYIWSNGGMGSSIVNVQAMNYAVTATDNNGCTISASIIVDQPDKVIASVGSDRWICIGETTTLNASATGGTPGYTFQWCHGAIGSSIDVSPVVTTQYCVKAIDTKSCESGLKYVTVFVYEPISVGVSADKYEICIGDPVILNATVSGGNGNYNYTLTNSGNTITLPYTDYPQGNITYEILASDNCGSPTDQASVDIIVNPLPPVSFMPDTTQGCKPLTVNFVEISPVSGQTYNWNFGDDNSYNTSNLKDPQHIYEYDGNFTVSLTVTSVKGCKNTKVNADLITVYPIPNAKFIADPEVASIIKPIIFFENLTTGAENFHWMFGDGDSSLNFSPFHQYAASEGTYIVELRVESEFGCKDTIFNSVIIRDEYTFYAPTAFSPDNDLVNDEFFITGHGIDENKYQLLIYDRWCEVIFDTKDVNGKWNGKAKNGNKKCETGTYIWTAIFKDKQGIEHQESGAVTIIR